VIDDQTPDFLSLSKNAERNKQGKLKKSIDARCFAFEKGV
jgi:hypothetical protein